MQLNSKYKLAVTIADSLVKYAFKLLVYTQVSKIICCSNSTKIKRENLRQNDTTEQAENSWKHFNKPIEMA